MNVHFMYVKCHAWEIIIKEVILVQRIKVKKNFIFQDLSFHCLFTNVYINTISL